MFRLPQLGTESRVKPAHEERDYSNPNEIRSSGDEVRLNRCQPVTGSCSCSSTERLLIYVSCIYLDLGQSGIWLIRRCCGGTSCFLQSKGGTPRKGYRDLPIFFDVLSDALKAHDAEEYGRILGAMRALLARHDK